MNRTSLFIRRPSLKISHLSLKLYLHTGSFQHCWSKQYAVSHRAIFNWVSKVIRDCIGYALLRSVIGLEISRHPLNQSDAKVKPIATWSLAFSRAWDRLPLFILSSHWSPSEIFLCSVLIGRYDYFGFGFTTLNRKPLYGLARQRVPCSSVGRASDRQSEGWDSNPHRGLRFFSLQEARDINESNIYKTT